MPVSVAPPRRLLTVAYTSAPTGTTTGGVGAALSPAWGGSFVIANRTSVEIEFSILDATNSVAGSRVEAVILVDGAEVMSRAWRPWFDTLGNPLHGRVRVDGLSAGSHTVAVNMRVDGNTGTFTMSSGQPGLLTVDEVD